MIYLDNAASSWPKPEETWRAMEHFMHHIGANPGRSGHRLSVEAGRILMDAREALADLFRIKDPLRISFTKNATEALNVAIHGILKSGDHCITTGMEHNSVMRPLRALQKIGVEVTLVPCSPDGELDPIDIKKAIKSNTKLIVTTHASNVTGTIIPIAEVGKIARSHDIPYCVDASQSAGSVPIDVEEMSIDLLAFTGHKALYGPQGTGGLYIRAGLEKDIAPLMQGGTGSRSESQEQPPFMPDKYESGTPNTVGIAGLAAGVRFCLAQGIEAIRSKEMALMRTLIDGLRTIPGIRLYGVAAPQKQIAICSFTVVNLSPAQITMALDEEFGIMSRGGLHCAPQAHKTIGTFPVGTTRLSAGYFNTAQDIEAAIAAIEAICTRGSRKG